MRILIADDTGPVRSAIRRLLNEEPDTQVVGEAANLGELMRLIRATRPNLILLDWELSGLPGSAKVPIRGVPFLTRADQRRNVILRSLRFFPSRPVVLVLSSRPEVADAAEAMGADGFVFKGDPPERLLYAVRAAASAEAD